MDDYQDFDGADDGTRVRRAAGPQLPGGVSPKAAASALLIVAVAAVLWLALMPDGDDDALGLPSATPPGTVVRAPGAAGTLLATSAAIGATGAATPARALTSTAAASLPGGTAPMAPPTSAAAPTVAGLPTAPGGATTVATVPPPTGPLAVGSFVRIAGTGTDGIRFRFGPGLDTLTIRIAFDGEIMKVLGGPEEDGGYTWWRLQDELGNVGWAASSFVEPVAAPGTWSPPVASPTFPAGGSQP